MPTTLAMPNPPWETRTLKTLLRQFLFLEQLLHPLQRTDHVSLYSVHFMESYGICQWFLQPIISNSLSVAFPHRKNPHSAVPLHSLSAERSPHTAPSAFPAANPSCGRKPDRTDSTSRRVALYQEFSFIVRILDSRHSAVFYHINSVCYLIITIIMTDYQQ